jgi:hypothetical protein
MLVCLRGLGFEIKHVKNGTKTFFNLQHVRANHIPHLLELFDQLQVLLVLLTDVVVDALLHRFLGFREPCKCIGIVQHHSLETTELIVTRLLLFNEVGFAVGHHVKHLVEVVHVDGS